MTARQRADFDCAAVYAAMDEKLTWTQVAHEIGGLSAAMLTHLAKGGRTGFPHVVRMAAWLDRPVASFVRAVNR